MMPALKRMTPWRALGASIGRSRAVLVVSAHWYIRATAVTAMGLSTNRAKIIVFCLSAFLAGIAGALGDGFWQGDNLLLGTDGEPRLASQVIVVPRDASGRPAASSCRRPYNSSSRRFHRSTRSSR